MTRTHLLAHDNVKSASSKYYKKYHRPTKKNNSYHPNFDKYRVNTEIMNIAGFNYKHWKCGQYEIKCQRLASFPI